MTKLSNKALSLKKSDISKWLQQGGYTVGTYNRYYVKLVEIFVDMLSIMTKLVITKGLKNDIRRVLVADEIHDLLEILTSSLSFPIERQNPIKTAYK